MKKSILIVLFLSLSALIFAQEQMDKQDILQLCIEVPELQSLLVDESGQQLQQLVVMSNENIQPGEISLTKFGKSVRVVDLETINELELTPYIIINTFEIDGNNATVYFQLASRISSLWHWFDLKLTNESETWQIVELNTMED